MLETSKDLLYIVIAFCVLWLTVFLCWLLFYFISIIGNVRKVVKSIQDKVEKIEGIIDLLKEKIESSATYLGLIVEGVGKIIEYFKDRGDDNTGKQNSKKLDKKIKIAKE